MLTNTCRSGGIRKHYVATITGVIHEVKKQQGVKVDEEWDIYSLKAQPDKILVTFQWRIPADTSIT